MISQKCDFELQDTEQKVKLDHQIAMKTTDVDYEK